MIVQHSRLLYPAVTVIYSHNEEKTPTENKTHGGYRP